MPLHQTRAVAIVGMATISARSAAITLKNILKRIFDSLSGQGDLIILENLVDENRSKDDCGMKISSMFAMLGYEGFALSFNEFKDLLCSVGFTEIQKIDRKPGVSDIIIARKNFESEKAQ